ncbi:MAG: UDP-N-acetylmuramoyl-tripeptide--D-alanyl-D-alanine ligase [Defluviitaleaceae bacterium]|nr:UDP-N-acetylmuramoyl-tripeptide--D-alanyl-D-alanine ligase [Defluviitaleaceae bacterium]MCL2835650.1 UDP-N-acetylmuramoyl-tripeptide--D-alanyl-D-alanine ligase [Defluviitaleaceae bacterium]
MRLTLREIAAAVNGRLSKPEYENLIISGVTTDSRNVPEGSLFVAVAGEFFDGHDFIQSAFHKGASCAVTHKELESARPLVIVEDTRKALLLLASYYLGLFNVKIVAITGSSGKTTTKDLIASVLSQRYRTHKTTGNLNNDIGLPITVFAMPTDTETAVLEMGMNHLGEISVLSRVAKPDIAVITNIGVSHIENLGSQKGILRAKLEILEGLKPGGFAIFNGDDEHLNTVKSTVSIYRYGLGKGLPFRAINIVKHGISGISFTCLADNQAFDVFAPLPGMHMVYNALAAVSVGLALGLTCEEIQAGIKSFQPSSFRLNITKNNRGITIIDDAYNSNPVSAAAALDVLAEAQGRRICVLGDMMELGERGPSMHYETGKHAAGLGIDLILCVGELSRHTYQGAEGSSRARYFADKEQALSFLKNELRTGDTVLVKASRAMAFEEISRVLTGGI